MTARHPPTKGHVKALYVVHLILLVILLLVEGTISSRIRNVKNSGESSSRSKRHVADLLVTDRSSRNHATHSRQVLLLRLLSLVDTSTGGRCKCLLEGKRGNKHKCHCDVTNLLSTLLKKLRTPGSSGSANLDEIISGLDHSTKTNLLVVVVKELKKSLRAKAVERLRLKRLRIRIMRRRQLIRQHPRSAFDGKQLVSF